MNNKFFRNYWAYWVCGKTDTRIRALMEVAMEFAQEIEVSIDKVHYEGVIEDSDWCKGFQLFSAPVGVTPPQGYTPIDIPAKTYISKNL